MIHATDPGLACDLRAAVGLGVRSFTFRTVKRLGFALTRDEIPVARPTDCFVTTSYVVEVGGGVVVDEVVGVELVSSVLLVVGLVCLEGCLLVEEEASSIML